ncbi:unnamed protein product [Boreogadus saida]
MHQPKPQNSAAAAVFCSIIHMNVQPPPGARAAVPLARLEDIRRRWRRRRAPPGDPAGLICSRRSCNATRQVHWKIPWVSPSGVGGNTRPAGALPWLSPSPAHNGQTGKARLSEWDPCPFGSIRLRTYKLFHGSTINKRSIPQAVDSGRVNDVMHRDRVVMYEHQNHCLYQWVVIGFVHMESDRPIRAGRCDMQSAVITALRRAGPGQGKANSGAPQ